MKPSLLFAGAIFAGAALWVLSGVVMPAAKKEPSHSPDQAESPPALAEPALPVRVETKEAERHQGSLLLRGRTEAERLVSLRSETAGQIAEIPIVKGQAVKKGEPLVVLKTDDRAARLAEAKANLKLREIEFDAARKLSAKGFKAETSLVEAEARLAEAKAKVTSIEIDLARTRLVAPFDGVIDDYTIEVGHYVQPGEVLLSLLDLDPVVVAGQVAERNVPLIKKGQTGTVRLATSLVPLSGTVQFVAPRADENTRTFRVEMTVPNPGYQISQGISAEMAIMLEPAPAHHVSPAILTLSEAGEVGVKVVGPGDIVQFLPVTILSEDGTGVWLSGLPQKVTFITVGQEYVKPGQKVKPVNQQKLTGHPQAPIAAKPAIGASATGMAPQP